MIKVKTSLYGIKDTVERPLKIKAMDKVKKYLGFQDRDMYYKLDEEDKVGRTKDKLGSITDFNSFGDEFMSLETESNIVEDYELSLKNINPDYFPIYKDKDIGSEFTPIHVNTKYEMNITYYAKSEGRVDAVVDRLKLNPSMSKWEIITDLKYSYIVPGYAMNLLIHINDLKNKRLVTPVDFHDYINNTFDDRVDVLNPEDGDTNKLDLVIRETQLGLRGYIRTDLSNVKKEYDDSLSMFKVTLSYEFIFEKPVSLLLEYPLMVWNNLIAKTYRINESDDDSYIGNRTYGSVGIHSIVKDGVSKYLTPPSTSYHLNIPREDNFKAEEPDPYMARVLSIICVVDYNNPTELFNLTGIPYIEFKDKILDFMKTEYPYMSDLYGSLFYIELIKDGVKDYKNRVIIDEELNLTTEFPMDIKSTYRVMINVLTYLNILSRDNLKRINDYVLNMQNETPENEVVSLIDYFLDLYDIVDLPISDMLNNSLLNSDLKYLTAIKQDVWKKVYTVQTSMIYAGILETKK